MAINDYFIKRSGNINEPLNVNVVKINGYELPLDVEFSISGDKMIVQSQIIDGVAVFEKVTRKPYGIDFNFVIRQTSKNQQNRLNTSNSNIANQLRNTPFDRGATYSRYVFPIDEAPKFFKNVFVPDQSMNIENVFINSLGIFNIVVQDIQIGTQRGNTDVFVRIKTIENFESSDQNGASLLIPDYKGSETTENLFLA